MDGALGGGNGPPVPPAGRPTPDPRALNDLEQDLWRWTNAARAATGLAPLRLHPALLRAARARCQEIVVTGVLAHASARWSSPHTLQSAFGARLRVMGGENLACCRNLAWVFTGLMGSPDHRANILHPEHRLLGVAVMDFRACGVAVCQEFGGD